MLFFSVLTNGQIIMNYGPAEGFYVVNVNCEDTVLNVQAVCTVYINVIYVNKEPLSNSGSIRLVGKFFFICVHNLTI